MKKSIKWLLPPVAAITLFFACKKNDRQATENANEFTVETVKAWFNANFTNTAEYKNGTKNGTAIKMPHWKMGRVYQIGKYNVAEFPLYINNRHVYISEQLPDADARRVVAGTLYKALFVQAPGQPMEVRIVQFTPTNAFLASKSYDISSLSFNNYVAQGFKGDMMLFDFDDNFKKGYHFSSGTTKEIHLYNKIAAANRNRNTGAVQTGVATHTESGELCDGVPIDPNCYYQIHTEYEYACSGGWNPLEGFNPSYCYITQIITVSCTLQYCLPGGGSALDECLGNGFTQAECMCQLYQLGCDAGGGGGEDEECTQFLADCEAFTAYASNSATSAMPESPTLKDTTVEWVVVEATNAYWKVVANTNMKYKGYLNGYTYHTNVLNFQTVSTTFDERQTHPYITTAWTQESINDNVVNNNTSNVSAKATVTGEIKQGCPINVHPLCPWLGKKYHVTNSRDFGF